MEPRTEFTSFPFISSIEPMNETPFWFWLEGNRPPVFIDALKEYLGNKGFDIQLHILPEEQLNTHKAVFQHFWWVQYHQKEISHA